MYLLHRIGPRINSNFNNLEEVLALPETAEISFDGIYESVWENREALFTRNWGRPPILFVMGSYAGLDNTFDVGQPYSKLLDWNRIIELVETYGLELGFHTYTHPDLTKLTDDQILAEINPPVPCKWFAYPGGSVDERVANLVKKFYWDAWSVNQGNGGPFQRNRRYLNH